MFVFFLFVCGILTETTNKKFCPNNCSHHGTCNSNGVCECYRSGTSDDSYPMYGGADCSIKLCPSGRVLFASLTTTSIQNTVGNANSGSPYPTGTGAGEDYLRRLSPKTDGYAPHQTQACAFDLASSGWIIEPYTPDTLRLGEIGGVVDCKRVTYHLVDNKDPGGKDSEKNTTEMLYNLNYYIEQDRYLIIEYENGTAPMLLHGQYLECTKVSKTFNDFAKRITVVFDDETGKAVLKEKYHHLLSYQKFIDTQYSFGCIMDDTKEVKVLSATSKGFNTECYEGNRCIKNCEANQIAICNNNKTCECVSNFCVDKDGYSCSKTCPSGQSAICLGNECVCRDNYRTCYNGDNCNDMDCGNKYAPFCKFGICQCIVKKCTSEEFDLQSCLAYCENGKPGVCHNQECMCEENRCVAGTLFDDSHVNEINGNVTCGESEDKVCVSGRWQCVQDPCTNSTAGSLCIDFCGNETSRGICTNTTNGMKCECFNITEENEYCVNGEDCLFGIGSSNETYRGICKLGKCEIVENICKSLNGSNTDGRLCMNHCFSENNNTMDGICMNETCICVDDPPCLSGDSCNCDSNGSNMTGICFEGKCECFADNCFDKRDGEICLNECLNNKTGMCLNGKCYCDQSECEIGKPCNKECDTESEESECVDGKCRCIQKVCNSSVIGELCLSDCGNSSSRGICRNNTESNTILCECFNISDDNSDCVNGESCTFGIGLSNETYRGICKKGECVMVENICNKNDNNTYHRSCMNNCNDGSGNMVYGHCDEEGVCICDLKLNVSSSDNNKCMSANDCNMCDNSTSDSLCIYNECYCVPKYCNNHTIGQSCLGNCSNDHPGICNANNECECKIDRCNPGNVTNDCNSHVCKSDTEIVKCIIDECRCIQKVCTNDKIGELCLSKCGDENSRGICSNNTNGKIECRCFNITDDNRYCVNGEQCTFGVSNTTNSDNVGNMGYCKNGECIEVLDYCTITFSGPANNTDGKACLANCNEFNNTFTPGVCRNQSCICEKNPSPATPCINGNDCFINCKIGESPMCDYGVCKCENNPCLIPDSDGEICIADCSNSTDELPAVCKNGLCTCTSNNSNTDVGRCPNGNICVFENSDEYGICIKGVCTSLCNNTDDGVECVSHCPSNDSSVETYPGVCYSEKCNCTKEDRCLNGEPCKLSSGDTGGCDNGICSANYSCVASEICDRKCPQFYLPICKEDNKTCDCVEMTTTFELVNKDQKPKGKCFLLAGANGNTVTLTSSSIGDLIYQYGDRYSLGPNPSFDTIPDNTDTSSGSSTGTTDELEEDTVSKELIWNNISQIVEKKNNESINEPYPAKNIYFDVSAIFQDKTILAQSLLVVGGEFTIVEFENMTTQVYPITEVHYCKSIDGGNTWKEITVKGTEIPEEQDYCIDKVIKDLENRQITRLLYQQENDGNDNNDIRGRMLQSINEKIYVVLETITVVKIYKGNTTITLTIHNTEYHPKSECSGLGECNRGSGTCECESGYTGYNCRRINCPNNCNGRGECVKLKDSGTESPPYLSNTDDDVLYYCKCNKGFEGYDCSIKKCPTQEVNGVYRYCSGHGVCDEDTGECECFDNFYGSACGNRNY